MKSKSFSKRLIKTILWTIVITIVPIFLFFLAIDLYEQFIQNQTGNNALFWTYTFGLIALMVTLPLAIISFLLVVFFEWKDEDSKKENN